MAGLEHGIQPLRANLRAGHHGRHFLLFDHFPVDEFFDVRMVKIEADHLGGAPCRAAGLDRPGRAVADP